ncbi:hypothetical protein [Sphingobacterium siyangense]|uniref:Uncharacterized protein n=1 Tax=Sphingobacterium siyangense TaxID=459529 RepID=A0A562MQG0_9SPHI|nr:hypothetical protein [Sphingobacterium siyangense]TWI22185.1 hypothetical protein IQ31_01590 [Sphingobacterium siyangense]
MKEELTSKMHSEFTVTSQTDVLHKVIAAVSTMNKLGYSEQKAAEIYGISVDDIRSYLTSL